MNPLARFDGTRYPLAAVRAASLKYRVWLQGGRRAPTFRSGGAIRRWVATDEV